MSDYPSTEQELLIIEYVRRHFDLMNQNARQRFLDYFTDVHHNLIIKEHGNEEQTKIERRKPRRSRLQSMGPTRWLSNRRNNNKERNSDGL